MELSKLIEDFRNSRDLYRKPEIFLNDNEIKVSDEESLQKLLVEDISTLEVLTEDSIVNLLYDRFEKGLIYSFIGDILLALNPDEYCERLFSDEVLNGYNIYCFWKIYKHCFRCTRNINLNLNPIMRLIFLL